MSYGSVPFVGRGKSGKSLSMYSFIEACPDQRSRPKAFYRFPAKVFTKFPSDYGAYNVNSFDEVEVGSLLILEDAARLFPSRNSQSTVLQKVMGVASHKDILVISTVQTLANVDQCLLRDQRLLLICKLMDWLSIAFERPELTDFMYESDLVIKDISQRYGYDHHLLAYCPEYSECLYTPPPDWYSYDVSHALRDLRILGDA
jgi:hypothetical protein